MSSVWGFQQGLYSARCLQLNTHTQQLRLPRYLGSALGPDLCSLLLKLLFIFSFKSVEGVGGGHSAQSRNKTHGQTAKTLQKHLLSVVAVVLRWLLV